MALEILLVVGMLAVIVLFLFGPMHIARTDERKLVDEWPVFLTEVISALVLSTIFGILGLYRALSDSGQAALGSMPAWLVLCDSIVFLIMAIVSAVVLSKFWRRLKHVRWYRKTEFMHD